MGPPLTQRNVQMLTQRNLGRNQRNIIELRARRRAFALLLAVIFLGPIGPLPDKTKNILFFMPKLWSCAWPRNPNNWSKKIEIRLKMIFRRNRILEYFCSPLGPHGLIAVNNPC